MSESFNATVQHLSAMALPISDRIRDAIKTSFGCYPAGPVHNSYWLGEGYVELSQFSGKVRFSAVFVLPEYRGQGLGRQYLMKVLDMCDAYGFDCTCSAHPFGDVRPQERHMAAAELKAWYKRHGFVQIVDRRDSLTRAAVSGPVLAQSTLFTGVQ